MSKNVSVETIKIVKQIHSLEDSINNEFSDFFDEVSNRAPISFNVPMFDVPVETHYDFMIDVEEKFGELYDSINFPSGSKKMDELKVILSHEMRGHFFDYGYYLQEYRIDLRLGMSTQVMSFLKAIVNDFERLDQWLLSVENHCKSQTE
jgi:isocitrate dehydrogenase